MTERRSDSIRTPGRTGRSPGGPADGRGPRWTGWIRRHGGWTRWVAMGGSAVVLTTAAVGWTALNRLDGNIRTDVGTAEELRRYEAERPEPAKGKAQNVLMLGSDSRGKGNGRYGRDSGTQRSDTAVLFHISGDHSRATAVSLPRDLMAPIPSCRTRDGSRTPERFAQFNSAFETGGAACTIRSVEKLTGMRVDHHLVVDFRGFTRLVDSVGGVEVCVPHDVDDTMAQLHLRAGKQTLAGKDALGFVRTRHGLGDGSDTERMGRQQQFMASLVKKLRSNGVLLNPAKVYPVLDAATSSLTADSGLDSLTELYELVRTVRNIPAENVRFLTVPRRPYALDINRDELRQPEAGQLFTALRHDRTAQVERHAPRKREAAREPSGPAREAGAEAAEKSGKRGAAHTGRTSGTAARTPGNVCGK